MSHSQDNNQTGELAGKQAAKHRKLKQPQYYAPDPYLNGDGQVGEGMGDTESGQLPVYLQFQACEDDACLVQTEENSRRTPKLE